MLPSGSRAMDVKEEEEGPQMAAKPTLFTPSGMGPQFLYAASLPSSSLTIPSTCCQRTSKSTPCKSRVWLCSERLQVTDLHLKQVQGWAT